MQGRWNRGLHLEASALKDYLYLSESDGTWEQGKEDTRQRPDDSCPQGRQHRAASWNLLSLQTSQLLVGRQSSVTIVSRDWNVRMTSSLLCCSLFGFFFYYYFLFQYASLQHLRRPDWSTGRASTLSTMKLGNLMSATDDGILPYRRSCILIHRQAYNSHLNSQATAGSKAPLIAHHGRGGV